MGAALSKVRSSDCNIVEENDGASTQIELRRLRRRSAVQPPARNAFSRQEQEDETTIRVNDFSKSNKIIDNIYSINRKWDYVSAVFLVIGIFVVSIALYFGIPAFYKLLQNYSSS